MLKNNSPSRMRVVNLFALAILIAGYGIYAFAERDIGSYMLLKTQFVFFDFEEPLIFFFVDYIAVMGLCIFIAYNLAKRLRKLLSGKNKNMGANK